VPQDTNLFNRTIRENIVYARPDATNQEVEAALKQAEALDFVKKLPNGLDTLVGERGVKLSGGQRQRIAIARAILKNSPLLILDEATSALDSVSEQAIQKALHELMQGRTTVVIAHRLSTLKHLDKIIVIEKGKIIEEGAHDDLLKIKDGVYADLWRRQKDGFIVE
jgi:ATP-binding cassette subfamily B protein